MTPLRKAAASRAASAGARGIEEFQIKTRIEVVTPLD
jgi:hypothetical protein